MKIHLNGETQIFQGNTLAELIQTHQPQPPFAVAINTVFIPKEQYSELLIRENDQIDIVQAIVGG